MLSAGAERPRRRRAGCRAYRPSAASSARAPTSIGAVVFALNLVFFHVGELSFNYLRTEQLAFVKRSRCGGTKTVGAMLMRGIIAPARRALFRYSLGIGLS